MSAQISAPQISAPATGLPVVNRASEPAWVRRGSQATQKAYAEALSFEQTLVEQLSRSLASSTGIGDESSQGESGSGEEDTSGAGAGSGGMSSMLPQALSTSIMSDGGLGLAAELTRGLAGPQGVPAAGTGTLPASGSARTVSPSGGSPA
jgi:hypothetical protein